MKRVKIISFLTLAVSMILLAQTSVNAYTDKEKMTLVPVVGDFDGDGKDDLSTKGSDGKWWIDFASNGLGTWDDTSHYGYGGTGHHPYVGDFDGDGKDDLCEKTDEWNLFIDYASNGLGIWDEYHYGYNGSDAHLVIGDFDGDGKDDLSVKKDDGKWWFDYASNGFGTWDDTSHYGYGGVDAYPIVGDFDGDCKDDLSVKTDEGKWNIDFASNGFGIWDEQHYGYGINTRVDNKQETEISDGEKIVNDAKKYLGVQYVWGGSSPSGFDCSGFVQYVYKETLGIQLPRTTYDQVNCGRAVSQSELKPGDLVFPHSGHVQIYVGNGQVIHAPQTGDVVKIGPMYKFWKARRIVG